MNKEMFTTTVRKIIAKKGNCSDIYCVHCPFENNCKVLNEDFEKSYSVQHKNLIKQCKEYLDTI